MFRTDRSRHLIGLSDGDGVLLTSKVTRSTRVADRLNQDKDFAYVQSVGVPVRPCSCRTLVRLGGGRGVRPRQGAVKAEQGDKRGDELFAEFTRLRQAAETGAAGSVRFRRLLLPATELRQRARMVGQGGRCGMVRAQIQLAMLYRDGDGGPQDKTEAARWFRKAAEQGMPPPRMKWAFSTERRRVDQDRVKAGTWFERAAASGSEDAETNLGWFYLDDSQGVYSATSDEEAALLDRYAGSRKRPSSGSARLRPREIPVPSSRWARPTGTVPVPG